LASAAATKRRASATTARIAAKERRLKIVVAVLAVVFAALLAYEVPHILKRSNGSSSAAPAAPTATTPTPASGHEAKRLPGSGNGADPFAAKSLPNGDAHAAAAGGPDPFTAPAASSSSAAAISTAALPRQIVIGRPGGHRVARHGWIVILASIRTRNGQSAAARFARRARGNVGALSVLNSSNRRPLRGGYWVVYSGPYATLGTVSRRAGDIHAAGYRTAYIRELIAYK
jgi:hypothetical protein